MKVKKTFRRYRKKRFVRKTNPSATQSIYRGPVVQYGERNQTRTSVIVLRQFLTVGSTVGGVIADVISSSPASAANWADTNLVWGEYRCLAMSMQYLPSNRYSKVTTTTLPCAVIKDRRNATALASLADGADHEGCYIKSLEDPWSMTMKMNGIEESIFLPVSGPTAFFWFKFYVSGLTPSTNYGYLLVTYRVQFRNVE